MLYTIDGQWTDTFNIKAGADHKMKKADIIDSYNARTAQKTALDVVPLEQQDPYESNRAWEKVAAAIVKSDMDTVHIEKSKIENSQRELRKKEQSEGREWQRRFFTRSATADPVFEQLVKAIPGERIESDKTGGVWRFDESKKNEQVGGRIVADGRSAGPGGGAGSQGVISQP